MTASLVTLRIVISLGVGRVWVNGEDAPDRDYRPTWGTRRKYADSGQNEDGDLDEFAVHVWLNPFAEIADDDHEPRARVATRAFESGRVLPVLFPSSCLRF